MSSHISFKILVVGDEDVGKTTIVNHYTLMPISFSSTIGIEFQSRMVALSAEEALHDDNLTVSVSVSKNAITPITPENMPRIKHYDYVKCYFWDTSGSARYQSLSHTYYTNISAAIVVFDLSNELSYKNLYSYIYRIIQKNICTHKHPILVIGNKFDKRKIHKTRIQKSRGNEACTCNVVHPCSTEQKQTTGIGISLGCSGSGSGSRKTTKVRHANEP